MIVESDDNYKTSRAHHDQIMYKMLASEEQLQSKSDSDDRYGFMSGLMMQHPETLFLHIPRQQAETLVLSFSLAF